MIADSSVAPMRTDPQTETVVPLDLRPAKAKLIEICKAVPVRLGRLFALGSWGDAVWVAHSYRDLRGICLLGWALDPLQDLSGRRRATPLGQNEFEEKLVSYDKRLDELDEAEIRASLEGANVTEEDGLIIVDVLEEDGTWDLQRSLDLELAVAAVALVAQPGVLGTPEDLLGLPHVLATEAEAEGEAEAREGSPLAWRSTHWTDGWV